MEASRICHKGAGLRAGARLDRRKLIATSRRGQC
jgi:hypothetical protein